MSQQITFSHHSPSTSHIHLLYFLFHSLNPQVYQHYFIKIIFHHFPLHTHSIKKPSITPFLLFFHLHSSFKSTFHFPDGQLQWYPKMIFGALPETQKSHSFFFQPGPGWKFDVLGTLPDGNSTYSHIHFIQYTSVHIFHLIL